MSRQHPGLVQRAEAGDRHAQRLVDLIGWAALMLLALSAVAFVLLVVQAVALLETW